MRNLSVRAPELPEIRQCCNKQNFKGFSEWKKMCSGFLDFFGFLAISLERKELPKICCCQNNQIFWGLFSLLPKLSASWCFNMTRTQFWKIRSNIKKIKVIIVYCTSILVYYVVYSLQCTLLVSLAQFEHAPLMCYMHLPRSMWTKCSRYGCEKSQAHQKYYLLCPLFGLKSAKAWHQRPCLRTCVMWLWEVYFHSKAWNFQWKYAFHLFPLLWLLRHGPQSSQNLASCWGIIFAVYQSKKKLFLADAMMMEFLLLCLAIVSIFIFSKRWVFNNSSILCNLSQFIPCNEANWGSLLSFIMLSLLLYFEIIGRGQ